MPVNSVIESAAIIETREVADRTFISKFRSPRIAPLVKPGQFVMVSFPETTDPLLPRAFSVCDRSKDTLSLLYFTVGRGTRRLASVPAGDSVVLNGPLGKGFPEMRKGSEVAVAVGGSGAALIPILAVASAETGAHVRYYYGARTGRQLVSFEGVSNLWHATDDGSAGYHGTVVDFLKKDIETRSFDMIFGCGPTPMLAAMQNEFGRKVPTYLSVETPMACGIGFCQGCPVKRAGGGDYYLACKDGPVFKSDEIEFEKNS